MRQLQHRTRGCRAMRRAVPAQRAAHATQSRRPYPVTLMYITIILPMLARAAPAHGHTGPHATSADLREATWRWQSAAECGGRGAHGRTHAGGCMQRPCVQPPCARQDRRSSHSRWQSPGRGRSLTVHTRPLPARDYSQHSPLVHSPEPVKTAPGPLRNRKCSRVRTATVYHSHPLQPLLMRATEQLRTVPNPSLLHRISHHTIPHSLQCFMPCIRLYTLHRTHAARNRIHSTRPSVLLYWKPTPTPPRGPPGAHHLLPSPAPRPVREPHRPRSPPAAPRSAASDRSPMRLPSGPRHACRPRR